MYFNSILIRQKLLCLVVIYLLNHLVRSNLIHAVPLHENQLFDGHREQPRRLMEPNFFKQELIENEFRPEESSHGQKRAYFDPIAFKRAYFDPIAFKRAYFDPILFKRANFDPIMF